MADQKRRIRQVPLIRGAVGFLSRVRTAARYFKEPLRHLFRWLFLSRETTNFTYDLTPANKRYLASTIADVLGRRSEEIAAYLAELEEDQELRNHIRAATQSSRESDTADSTARYGRRLGWYAFVRALRPKIVVETGVDKGLGSCVIAAALRKNAREGHPGYYYGTDINPRAGYLLSGPYEAYGEILYGDSIASLATLDKTIDLFINDSDHSAAYEEKEYAAVAEKLSHGAIVLGDNAHCTDRLLNFAQATDRHFLFFREEPRKHWYPGAGIGIAFRRQGSEVHPEP
ncbi:MAG: class I SAM-dependent methyltransferase [Planctomycetota bacterium]